MASHVPTGYRLERNAAGLTKREREVLQFLFDGLDMPGMAEQLGLTKQRISAIVKSLEKKGGVVRKDGEIHLLTASRKWGG